MELEYTFEPSGWELTVEGAKENSTMSAAKLLALMEGEDDGQVEAALEMLNKKHIALDVSDLPKFSQDSQMGARLHFEESLIGRGDWVSQLEEADPLRLYLEELSSIPATGDLQVLAREMLAGNTVAQQNLVNVMLSRVIEIAGEYTGRGVLLLDLIQEGSLGLWQGLQAYGSGDVQTHCDWWIRQFMAGSVLLQAKQSGVGQKLRQAMEDYRDVDQKLLTELGRNPTVEEMAAALHMTPQQAMTVAETLENAQLLQQAKAPAEAPQESQEEELAVEDTAYFQMRQRIEDLLSSLPDDDAKLLSMRYGLEGGIPMKPQQVALKLGITTDEVTAREAAALAKLRDKNS